MKEIQYLMDAIPYWLLFVLPIFIALSPYNPVCNATELNFPVHRLAQYDLSGSKFGSKSAAVSIEARTATSVGSNLLRKMVTAKLHEISVSKLNDIITAGAGGILLIIPEELPPEAKESFQALEEFLLSSEIEVPVYFAYESQDLDELLTNLHAVSNEATSSAAQVLLSNIASNGYQMVSSSSASPRAITDNIQTSIESTLRGSSDDDSPQTVVVVAHYDAHAPAPELAFGADSNGSGVTVLLELARLFGRLYKDPKTRPKLNLVFLLSAAGHWNFYGTKKWLEDHLDQNANSELLTNTAFAVCLDTIGGGLGSSTLHMHVSKPPKEDSAAGRFLDNLQSVSQKIKGQDIKLIHKKINLADEILAWEHERFSIRRMPAFTLSHMEKPSQLDRATLYDKKVDQKTLQDNTRIIAEALLCSLYDVPKCTGQFFVGSLEPQAKSIKTWSDYFSRTSRYAGLMMSGPQLKKTAGEPGVIDLLGQTVYSYTSDLRYLKSKLEKQDPEFVFYDLQTSLTLTAYNVKPAVFDLVLTCIIASYLGLVYLVILKSGVIVKYVHSFTKSESTQSSPYKTNGTYTNGKMKVK